MKHTSKFLAIFLTLAMVIGLLGAAAVPAGAAGAVSCNVCNDTGVDGPKLCFLCGGMCILTVGGAKPTSWAGQPGLDIVTASITVPNSVSEITDDDIGLLSFTDDEIESWGLPEYADPYVLTVTVYTDAAYTAPGPVSLTEGVPKEVYIHVDNGLQVGFVGYGVFYCITVTRSAADDHPCINGHTWEPCPDGQNCQYHGPYFPGVIPLHHTCQNCSATEACEDSNSDGKCDKCGQDMSPPHAHTPGAAWTKDATGHWKTCGGCTDKLDFAAHTAGSWIIDLAATHTTAGSRHNECTVCGYVTTEAIPAIGHTYGSAWVTDATGHWKECSCGDKSGFAAHTPGDWITDTEATETADGTKHKECTVCAFVTETGTIPRTGDGHTHTPGAAWVKDATAHWKTCGGCTDILDFEAHTAGEWIVDTEATATTDGSKHKECTVCKHVTEEEVIPATGNPAAPDKIFDWFGSWMPTWLATAFSWVTKYIFFGWLWGRWL
ncbi:MAG: hypothetical protein FWH26_07825 [Oscillospiraceae bacterium]|nr:hypothetical protein [Oscillospiraceae bacterium]